MAFDLNSIQSAKRERPLRVVALGRPKTGKSTFASSAPAPVVLPIKGEEGIDALDVPAFPVIARFGDLMEAFGTLYSAEHPYRTVVVDSISTLEALVWDEVCRIDGKAKSIEQVGGGYGKGYIETLRLWREVTEALDALRAERNMGCILIGHVKVKRFNDPLNEAYDHYSFDINDKAVELLTRWADGILFFNRKIAIKKEDLGFNKMKARAVDLGGGAPMIYTQERPSHPGGGRGKWGKIPYELAFGETNGWAVLESELAKAQ